MDIDKKIAEIPEYYRKFYLTDDLTVQGLIDQLKECREEARHPLIDRLEALMDRLEAAKAKIEQRTKDAIREYLKLGLSELFVSAFGIKPQSDKLPLRQEELSEWVDRAIEGVGGRGYQ